MIAYLLVIFSLSADGAGTVTVTPHPSRESCDTARASVGGECHAAPGGEVEYDHPVLRTLRYNRCEMVAADQRVAIWECKGVSK